METFGISYNEYVKMGFTSDHARAKSRWAEGPWTDQGLVVYFKDEKDYTLAVIKFGLNKA